MKTTKPAKSTFDQKSPDFIAFKNRFKNRFSTKGDSFHYEQDGCSIAADTVESPPHQAIVLELFPDITLSKFLEISKEIFAAGQSDLVEIADYYETHFSQYSFNIKFTTLYEIYLKHSV